MIFLDRGKPRPDPGGPAAPASARLPALPPELALPARRPSPMQRIADRLEQRVAADFSLFNGWLVAARRHGEGPSIRRLAAHLAAEARPLHALGGFALALELSPAAANAWLLPADVDPGSLPGGWADALYTNRLRHADDLDRGLAGMSQMLRPGGLLLIDLPASAAALERGMRPGRAGGGIDLVGVRDAGLLQGRAWRRATLVRAAG